MRRKCYLYNTATTESETGVHISTRSHLLHPTHHSSPRHHHRVWSLVCKCHRGTWRL